GDGRLDVVVPHQDGIHLLLGNGDGTLRPAVALTAEPCYSIIAADLDGDGKVDLAAIHTGQVAVLLGDGKGGFRKHGSYEAGIGDGSELVVGDFDRDGKPDLALGEYVAGQPFLTFFRGNGDGSFQPFRHRVADSTSILGACDLDGDGKLDLIGNSPA